MSRFYLKISAQAVAGPFTGVELREAALAHLVLPNTRVAGTADGPWMRAADVGLFSEENVPLSHPPGTAVPEFRLTGFDGSIAGPFKLRELIDFAVRQMLPSDASVQPVGRSDWISVNQLGILGACLRGELTLNPTSVTTAPVSPKTPQDDPVQRRKRTNTTKPKAESLHSHPIDASNDGVPPVTSIFNDTDLMGDPEESIDSILSDHREQARRNIRERIANESKNKSKIAYAGGLVVTVLVGVLVWWGMRSSPQPSRTDLSEVIGNWVAISSAKNGKAFGISFREDGTCVVFNSNGDCWSGDIQWLGDATSEAVFQSLGSTNSMASDTASIHQRFEVLASDGYLRFNVGLSDKPPMLGDTPIRECFVRRSGDYLWIGYLATVDLTGESQSLEAAWAPLWSHNLATSFDPLDVEMRGKVLLARFGVPDEARRLHPSEIMANSDPEFAEPCSLIRYGTQRLTLFADGSVRRFRAPETTSLSGDANP